MDEQVGPRDSADVGLGTDSVGAEPGATGRDPDLQELEVLEERLRDLEQELVSTERDDRGAR